MDNESQVKKDLRSLDLYLVKFETGMGLPPNVNLDTLNKAQDLLDTDWASYKDKDYLELALDACILTDYSGIVQRVINREKSTILWCKERIRKLIGAKMSSYERVFSFEERECLALEAHPFGNELHKCKTEAELRLSRFEGINYSVKNLADKLQFLSKIKLKQEKLKQKGV